MTLALAVPPSCGGGYARRLPDFQQLGIAPLDAQPAGMVNDLPPKGASIDQREAVSLPFPR